MEPITVGNEYTPGKIARIQCVKNDTLKEIDIRGKCFLLLILFEGEARFGFGERVIEAHAPCLVCFDERQNPRVLQKRGLKCHAVYFDPRFFNVNLTFERVRSREFQEVASAHDLYLMMPFTDESNAVFPVSDEYATGAIRLFESLMAELDSQRDNYWSCRSRTYFIRLLFLLERMYGLMGETPCENALAGIRHPGLRAAVIYIEGHYSENISRVDIARAASTNHTTLGKLFKDEFGMTAVDYLWHHRITVAKRQLRFTHLPVTEIAAQSGFKTLPHFCRKFEEATGMTPRAFREEAVARRKKAFGGL